MTRTNDSETTGRTNRTDGATPHELVRALEKSIAARLAAANRAGDEVALAQVKADRLVAEAEAQAAEVARQRTTAILSAARAEAARVTQAGIRRAAALTAVAARRRDQDVGMVVSAALPQQTSHDEVSRS
jgi:F0F1-type ATP synthase membrane subunit b/b'